MNEFRKDLDVALRIVWLLTGVVILVLLAAPFVLGSDRVAQLTPVCQAKLRGSRCSFCGMTTGFLAISEGRFDDARRANAAAIPLYGLFILNELGMAVFARRRKGELRCK